MPSSMSKSKGKIARTCEFLRRDILKGVFLPGSTLPTHRALGKRYGVAYATASAAVGRLVHEGLAVTVQGRGSFVADELPVTQKVLDFVRMRRRPGEPEKGGVLAFIEDFSRVAEQRGWTPRWHHVDYEEFSRLADLGNRFLSSQGLIAFGNVPTELLWILARKNVPLISFLARGGNIAQCYTQISFDRRQAVRMATEHLVSSGHSRIGYVDHKSAERTLGFMDVVHSHKLAIRREWLVSIDKDITQIGSEIYMECRKRCAAMLADTNRPEALCCSTANIARVVASVAIEAGLSIPGDLAIVAADIGHSRLPEHVTITTVSYSHEEACHIALDKLEEVSSSDGSDDHPLVEPIMLPLHLTAGDSCGTRRRGNFSKTEADKLNKERPEESPMA